jgi:hypothetical protein
MQIKVEHHKDFIQSLNVLYRKGGPDQKKGERVDMILSKARRGSEPFHGLIVTKETRIDHCVKYELSDGYRLVTIQDNKMLLFCFVGQHDHAEKWIERHKGKKLIVNKNGEIDEVKSYDAYDINDTIVPKSNKKLLDEIGEDNKVYIGKMADDIEIYTDLLRLTFETEGSIIESSCNRIGDEVKRDNVLKVLMSIKKGDTDNAIKIIDVLKESSKELSKLNERQILSLKDGECIKEIKSDEHLARILKVIESPHYQEWMLFMHPEQQAIIDTNFDEPALLSGVSGSGKTCIVVHRAIRLAEEIADKHILILTLNRSLAKLISDLLDYSCTDSEVRNRILCKSFFDICREMLIEFEPENSKCYDFITWKMNEHIDNIWREFYRCEANNDDANVLFRLHKTLLVRRLRAEDYIRQEFDYARCLHNYNDYLKVEREGRAIPLLRQQAFQPSNDFTSGKFGR